MFNCKFCNAEKQTKQSVIQHQLYCSLNPNYVPRAQTVFKNTEVVDKIKNSLKQYNTTKYNENPKLCKGCNSAIPFDNRMRLYCSNDCKKANGVKRPQTKETKNKISISLKSRYENTTSNTPSSQMNIALKEAISYTKLFTCKCSYCGTVGLYATQQLYCNEHSNMYASRNRNKYVFTFNIYYYPDLFDLELLKQIGWRNSKTHPNGMSRDHKVSVAEAIKNNYDPYYIKHVMNCALIPFNENNKKHTKSSITYQELVK